MLSDNIALILPDFAALTQIEPIKPVNDWGATKSGKDHIMHRTFISTIVAAALIITGISASSAQADVYRNAPQYSRGGNEAVAATLAGLAALVIIGKTIENNRSPRKTVVVPAPAPRHMHRPGKRVVRKHHYTKRQHGRHARQWHNRGGRHMRRH